MPARLKIVRDEVRSEEILALLREHMAAMESASPAESRHALDVSGLRGPDVTVWSIWDEDAIAGCGALKQIDRGHAEIKSMRTAPTHLRRGVASQMLEHLIAEARRRGYRQLSLETGSMDYFEPARKLYASFGFVPCAPFGSYVEDPNSVFMTKAL